jgi:hypothetical protein
VLRAGIVRKFPDQTISDLKWLFGDERGPQGLTGWSRHCVREAAARHAEMMAAIRAVGSGAPPA